MMKSKTWIWLTTNILKGTRTRKVPFRVPISMKRGRESDIFGVKNLVYQFLLKLVPLKGLFAFESLLKCSLLVVFLYEGSMGLTFCSRDS